MIGVALPLHKDSIAGCMITVGMERRSWLSLFCRIFPQRFGSLEREAFCLPFVVRIGLYLQDSA